MDSIDFNAGSSAPIPENVTPDAGIGELHKDFKPLYDRFGAKEGSERTDKALAMIWEYAKEHSELKDKDSVLWEVRKLEMRLGSPPYGQKPWLNILTYISTHNQMRQAEERLRQMEMHN